MTDLPAWHQALAYAVTGCRFEELGRQAVPDLDEVTTFLQRRMNADLDPTVLAQVHRVSPELSAGLGAAQLSAAVAELRRRLAARTGAVAVTAERSLTVDERRLLQDVPPHHGS